MNVFHNHTLELRRKSTTPSFTILQQSLFIGAAFLVFALWPSSRSTSYALQAGGFDGGDYDFSAGDPPNLPIVLLGLEVTQAIQSMNPENPLDSSTNNKVPLIAEKKTFVRAYFNVTAQSPLSPGMFVPQRVRGTIEGRRNSSPALIHLSEQPLVQNSHLIFDPNDNGNLAEKRRSLNKSLNFELPMEWVSAGELKLKLKNIVSLGSSQGKCPGCDKEVIVKFLPSAPMVVKFIKFVDQRNNLPTIDFAEHIAYITSWLRRAFPLSPGDLHILVEQTPQTVSIGSCEDAANATAAKRFADENAGLNVGKVRYVGLFINNGRTDGKMSGCTYIPLSAGNKGISNAGNSVAVPLGYPYDWPEQMDWDQDKSYADAYTGHELGHTFGLVHLPFGVGCLTPPQSPCPAGPYDGSFPDGLISGSDGAFFGFDSGDAIDRCPIALSDIARNSPSFKPCTIRLTARPLPGDQWHDMMTYSKYWWVSSRQGPSANGASQAGKSYQWIRARLMEENALIAPFPPAFPLPNKERYLKLLVHVNLTHKTSHILIARQAKLTPQDSLPSPDSRSSITLIGKKGKPIGKPTPALVLTNPDAQPDSDRTIVVEGAIPLPNDIPSTELGGWQLMISKELVSSVLGKNTTAVNDFVITVPISHKAPTVEGLRAYRTENGNVGFLIDRAADSFFEARELLAVAKTTDTKKKAEQRVEEAMQSFNTVVLKDKDVLKAPITLRWIASDDDTAERTLTYMIRVSADNGQTWHTLAQGHPNTSLTIGTEQIRSLEIKELAEMQIEVVADDQFNESSAAKFTILVNPKDG